MMTKQDEFRWDCIKGTRAIKDKLDAKFASMKRGEVSAYIQKEAMEFRKQIKNLHLAT